MYSYQDLVNSYRAVGLEKGDTIVLKTSLLGLGRYADNNKQQTLNDHVRAIDEVIDLDVGTLVVATSSTNLCNTNTPFDLVSTPSIVGALTEFVRKMPEAIRTYHAFESYAAVGAKAQDVTSGLSKFSYGLNTPEDRLFQMRAKCVCLGIEPRLGTASVHHVETLAHVPYRYTKEYQHPIVTKNKIIEDTFYRYVWYQDCGIQRSGNKLFFEKLFSQGLKIHFHPIGSGYVSSFDLSSFVTLGVRVMQEFPFIWLKGSPTAMPWTQ